MISVLAEIVTAIGTILLIWIAWSQLQILIAQLKALIGSVSDVKGSVIELKTAMTANLSIHYSATSIRSRFSGEGFNVKDVLDVIHDSLIQRTEKIDKKALEQLVDAAVKLVEEIDKKE